MASQGPLSPGTLVNDSSNFGDVAWSNPGNAAASDDSRATCAVDPMETGAYSQYLKATNFGFTIPAGATIDGVVVEIERSRTGGSGATFTSEVYLVKGGTIGGDNISTPQDWPTTEAYFSHGGATVLWSLSLTDSDVNASNFGVVVSGQSTSVAAVLSIDHIRITVYYTEGGGGQNRRRRAIMTRIA